MDSCSLRGTLRQVSEVSPACPGSSSCCEGSSARGPCAWDPGLVPLSGHTLGPPWELGEAGLGQSRGEIVSLLCPRVPLTRGPPGAQ